MNCQCDGVQALFIVHVIEFHLLFRFLLSPAAGISTAACPRVVPYRFTSKAGSAGRARSKVTKATGKSQLPRPRKSAGRRGANTLLPTQLEVAAAKRKAVRAAVAFDIQLDAPRCPAPELTPPTIKPSRRATTQPCAPGADGALHRVPVQPQQETGGAVELAGGGLARH